MTKENLMNIPECCGYCGKKVGDKETIEIADWKIYHPECMEKLEKEGLTK